MKTPPTPMSLAVAAAHQIRLHIVRKARVQRPRLRSAAGFSRVERLLRGRRENQAHRVTFPLTMAIDGALAMQPGQAKFLLDFLLPQLKSEQAVTKRVLCAIPPDCGEYKPHRKCMTAIQLAWHVAMVEMWFLDAVIQRQFGKTSPWPPELRTGFEVAQWHEENFAQRVPLLEALSGEALITPVDFIGLRNDPAVAYLNIAMRHSVHHRGQLSTYLRTMGAKVPAIYVESADEPYPPSDGYGASGMQAPPVF